MHATSETNAAAYHACLDEARRQAPLMAKRWYTLLSNFLLEKSTTPLVVQDKYLIHDAWLALKKHQADIEQGFAQQISLAIERDAGGSSIHSTGRSNEALGSAASSLKFQDLELMGEDQVQDTLDEARLAQTLLLTSESGLAGFSARLSTAQGLKVVTSNKNPLRPYVYASALVHVLQGLPVAIGVRTRWLIYGGQIMGELLQALYAALDELLEKRGMKQAGYAVVPSPEEPKRIAVPANPNSSDTQRVTYASASPAAMAMQPAMAPGLQMSREKLLTLDHLHRLLAGDYDESFNAGGPFLPAMVDSSSLGLGSFAPLDGAQADFSPSMSAALGALVELKQKSAGQSWRKNGLSVPSSPIAQLREKLRKQSTSLGQSLAIEVVGLMIEQLTADERLLPPVRQAISHAEPAFLRIGAADPDFFTDKNHPARRLLEVITARSLAFASQDDGGFDEFMQDLQASIEPLAQDNVRAAQDFADLLQDFEDLQARRNQVVSEAQKLAVQALIQAEQRNLLAEKIASEIRQRSDFVAGNLTLAAFITGPWAQVIAKERLSMQDSTASQQKAIYSLALGDILWSVDFAQASRQRERLVKLIPDLVNRVREGLLTIGYPLSQSKVFFDELLRLHEQALTARSESIETSRKNSTALDETFARGDAQVSNQTWLQPSEVEQSGFMDFTDTAERTTLPLVEAVANNKPGLVFEGDQPDADALLPERSLDLQLGSWVDLVARGQWVRAQLIWISPHSTLFMFVSAGGSSYSMTARMRDQLESQRRFRVVTDQGLVDGALDTVAQAAIRNSMQGRAAP